MKKLLTAMAVLATAFTLNAQYSTSFTAGEGYTDGDLTGQDGWFADKGQGTNLVTVDSTAGIGDTDLAAANEGRRTYLRQVTNAELGDTLVANGSVVEYYVKFIWTDAVNASGWDYALTFGIGGDVEGNYNTTSYNDYHLGVAFFELGWVDVRDGDVDNPNGLHPGRMGTGAGGAYPHYDDADPLTDDTVSVEFTITVDWYNRTFDATRVDTLLLDNSVLHSNSVSDIPFTSGGQALDPSFIAITSRKAADISVDAVSVSLIGATGTVVTAEMEKSEDLATWTAADEGDYDVSRSSSGAIYFSARTSP